jgi:hypothetical protein
MKVDLQGSPFFLTPAQRFTGDGCASTQLVMLPNPRKVTRINNLIILI